MRKTLLAELDMKIPKSELELQKEPFLMLGYGVNSYFGMIYSIMQMFIIISVVSLPLFYAYKSSEAVGM